MNYTIRKAVKADMPAVLKLIQELADFENEPDAVEVSVNDLERLGFGKEPLFYCFVAEVDGNIEGMALFYYRFSTWKGKTVHLEDLIVRKDFRNAGLGSALYKEVMKFAHDQNLKRVEWVVLDWNKTAADFYKRSGANVLKHWDTVQMDEKGLNDYIKKS